MFRLVLEEYWTSTNHPREPVSSCDLGEAVENMQVVGQSGTSNADSYFLYVVNCVNYLSLLQLAATKKW